ncbi:putative type I restriction enzymeP M protein [Planctomycetes bacterium CA13]|uniref:site-specific DNA-methyltransferase (adenine-specific) n=1 Tax=Novipirellula herctigrandis TaxID=2527986 RepID=A0A5C5Z0W1_9BACT|nr:putative type I restriction enzymeP M protein [Planctomycetes bacterium CA13]
MAKKKATKKKAASAGKATSTVDHRRQEVQQIVKNACDQLNSEGVDARNYVEQLAWLFFLKAFDEAETRREEEAAFDDTPYERRLSGPFAWSSWASKTDRPDEMLEFVDGKLWIKLTSPDPKKGLGDDPLAERFRRIFDNVRNYSRRGASFARVVQQVDKLEFSSETDVHVLSEIYEDLLKRVAADSAGYAGEFYTQRHIIRAMVEVVSPQVGDRVYDPCFGTSGFLGEAADYMRESVRGGKGKQLSGKDLEKLQNATFYGLEIKPLTYLLGTMNMILHGIESANLELGNTLELHNQNVSEKDRYDVILSNPPYGGKMASELQTNFRVRSAATECLFLQHIMRNLGKGGRAAVILPEGVSFRGGPDQKVRQELLEQFNLHTILSLPAGCFLPYTGVKTNVLFFDRPTEDIPSGKLGTKKVWFYELTNDGFELKQTRRPIDGNQLPEFLKLQPKQKDSDHSWSLSAKEIIENGYDISAKNPNRSDDFEHRPALELVQSIRAKEERIIELLDELAGILETSQ